MQTTLKNLIKKLPVNFSKNHRYDRETSAIIKEVTEVSSNCIDIGCHKGEIFEQFLAHSPEGYHYGFEPVPELYQGLVKKFKNENCTISPIALSNKKGSSEFNYVISNPSYSGLTKRRYDRPHEVDKTITVQTDLLDNLIPEERIIDFIKIDVEGGEYHVLQGAKNLIHRCRPVIIFEHGLGGADCYGIHASDTYKLLHDELQYDIFLTTDFLKGQKPLSGKEFVRQFDEGVNYYFVAAPK